MHRSRLTVPAALVGVGQMLFAQPGPPAANKQPVTDVYHGVKVTDDYRWLEDWSTRETQAWSEAQNAYARNYLSAVPGRAALHEQVKTLLSKPSSDFRSLRLRGDMLFALRT